MKKLLSILLLTVSVLGLLSCSSASKVDDSTIGKIVYGEKYIRNVNDPEEQQRYYVIYDDHLEFHDYYKEYLGDDVSHYKMKFKYTIVDESTLAYFYDSVECYDDCNQHNHSSSRAGVLIFSENVLIEQSTSGFVKYVRESYLEDELTNYCKTEED